MIWRIAIVFVVASCGAKPGPEPRSVRSGTDPLEPDEAKVPLDKTPEAVQKTIQGELIGGQLEDISRKQLSGKTIYETDIIRNGEKWEVIVGEDGKIISKSKEDEAEETAENKEGTQASPSMWKDTFTVNKANLAPIGNNPYFPIQPGSTLHFQSSKDKLTVTVLREPKVVDGVKVAVVEEREEKAGKLVEVSRNYFATDTTTNDVYYFGEDTDNYKDGKVIDHESSWLAGEKDARFGLMIPGKPEAGQKFYQELAPKVAMDRVEVVSTDETKTTPAGVIEHCMHLRETTPLESDVSHKWYCRGIGMVKDDEFELVQRP